MNKVLTIGETRAVLTRLRGALAQSGEREATLRADRDRELEAVQRKYGLLKARGREQVESAAAHAEAARESEFERRKGWYAARESRIRQAFANASGQLEADVETMRSQQKYESQKELLTANRDRDAAVQSSEKTAKAFLSELEGDTARFEAAKNRAWDLIRGYGTLRRSFLQAREGTVDHSNTDEYAVRRVLVQTLDECEAAVGRGAAWPLARVFARVAIFWWLLLVGGVGGALQFGPGWSQALGVEPSWVGPGCGIALGLVGMLYGLGFLMVRRSAQAVIGQLWASHGLLEWCRECVASSQAGDVAQIEANLAAVEERLEQAWKLTDAEAASQAKRGEEKLTQQRDRLLERNSSRQEKALEAMAGSDSDAGLGGLEANSLSRIDAEQSATEAEIQARFESGMQALLKDWDAAVPPSLAALRESGSAAEADFPAWDPALWNDWELPTQSQASGRLANLSVVPGRLVDRLPSDSRFQWDAQTPLQVPLAVRMPLGESLLVESAGTLDGAVGAAINQMILRLLLSSPLGRLQLTLLDPVGLGQNFSGLMHLADHDEQLINRRIWTQSGQIETCLRDLTEHMEKVTQMYLRNEYATLAEYNEAAGTTAEKYQLLVVADFPVGFTDTAIRRLQSIVTSGPRCGVFVVMHRDTRQAIAETAIVDDFREHMNGMEVDAKGTRLVGAAWPGVSLQLESAPEAELAIDLIHRVGRAHRDSNRVEVPFTSVIPSEEAFWSLATESELRVPIGRTGAAKLQELVLGKGTQQHALIAGKTGSGKSTLFHVLITNLALWCRPDQVEFYLVDFKKGVEFKSYAKHRLPHARVVAIESDREFGLSVLERVDREMRRRGELYREHGVQDLAGYHRAAPEQPLPRTLLLIDEFQEFFVEDDRVSQNAAVLLDRIVRQGRAFGIHVILGSQTLGGAYTLARTTFAQMVIRIALQCDEADSYLIMDESNAAPRLLTRPGEGIYNDSGGAVEGNSPFQTVWLSDEERDTWLKKVSTLARLARWEGEAPVIFEGNAPADIRDNGDLQAALGAPPMEVPASGRAWLGAPNAIKGPTAAVFERQGGSHLLVIGQNEEMAFSMMMGGLVSLAAQYPADGARFVILDSLAEHAAQREVLDRALALLPQPVQTLRDADLESLMSGLEETLEQRGAEANAPAVFVVCIGLQRFRKLRPADEFSFSTAEEPGGAQPGDVLDGLVREGSAEGIHVLASVDSYNSAQRALSRKALSEIEMRVLFQMSANDSAALIDSTQASQLGLHRALYYNERQGYLETFRPYSLPDLAWWDQLESVLVPRKPNASVSS